MNKVLFFITWVTINSAFISLNVTAKDLTKEAVEKIVEQKIEEQKVKTSEKSGGKISGLVFADFAWFARYHTVAGSTARWEKKTTFWIKRAYFTYDHTFDKHFSGRFRFEAISGDFDDNGGISDVVRPFVKEVSLKWKANNHSLSIGMTSTPTWALVESHWGYRSVEKTPVDLQGFGNAVDLGVNIEGTFLDDKLGYTVMVGNGSGTRFEINDDKKFYGAVTVKPTPTLAIQAQGDFETGAAHTDRFNLQSFVGFTKETWRIGGLFAYRFVQKAAGGNQTMKLFSGHGAFKLAKKLWSFARVDHLFNVNPNGNTLQFLPMENTAKPTFMVVGVDIDVYKNIHLLPNVETIFYSRVAGVRPQTDIVPKMTFAWNF